MTLFGWDASDFDYDRGPMNLDAAHRAGIEFFTYKATEGVTVKHAHYGECLNRARAAGIEFLGAYIVPRSAPTVAAQVSYFLDYVNSATPWWTSYPGFFFQVDTEQWKYDSVSARRGADVCAELRRRTNRRVVHYAPSWAYGNTIPQPDPLWSSNYGNNPIGDLQQMYPGDASSRWSSYSGRTPVFLQFGSKLVIGTQHTCDGNAFRGKIEDLRKFITGSSTTPAAAEGDYDVIRYQFADSWGSDRPGDLGLHVIATDGLGRYWMEPASMPDGGRPAFVVVPKHVWGFARMFEELTGGCLFSGKSGMAPWLVPPVQSAPPAAHTHDVSVSSSATTGPAKPTE